MRDFMAPNLDNPRVGERIPGSMFTPAIAAWSSPGALGAYLGALPSWAGMAGVGAFLGLAYFKKIPWWAGLGGALLSYMYLGVTTNSVQPLTSGTGIAANGSTYNFSANTPATLVTQPNGQQLVLTADGTAFPLISTQKNADGSTTYYLDNPAGT